MHNHMSASPAESRAARQSGRRYWLLLPLIFAIATWAVIVVDNRHTVELAITISVYNSDSSLIMVDIPRPTVRLRVSGTKARLDTIDEGQTACSIDLSGLPKGTHHLPVKPSDVRLPKGIALDTLLTPTVTVTLVPAVRKTVKVVPMLTGKPAPGYRVTHVDLKPDQLVLRGTADMLADLDAVRTGPIDLEGAAESFKKEVPLNLADAIRVEPSLRIVIAEVKVEERVVTRVMENVPVVGQHTAAPFQIHPGTITLTVSGPEIIVDTIEESPEFSVTIDLKDLASGTHTLRAAIHLPVQLSLVRAFPEQFSVEIK